MAQLIVTGRLIVRSTNVAILEEAPPLPPISPGNLEGGVEEGALVWTDITGWLRERAGRQTKNRELGSAQP